MHVVTRKPRIGIADQIYAALAEDGSMRWVVSKKVATRFPSEIAARDFAISLTDHHQLKVKRIN